MAQVKNKAQQQQVEEFFVELARRQEQQGDLESLHRFVRRGRPVKPMVGFPPVVATNGTIARNSP